MVWLLTFKYCLVIEADIWYEEDTGPATGPATDPITTTTPVAPVAPQVFNLMNPKSILIDTFTRLGIDSSNDPFFDKLDEMFPSSVFNQTSYENTGYNLSNQNTSFQYINKDSLSSLKDKLSNLDANLAENFKAMIKNLLKANIYSFYDKKISEGKSFEAKTPEDNEEIKQMFGDIINLVNKSLSETNAIFEKKVGLPAQAGGSYSKIKTMNKYFKYKLKYMILKNELKK